MGNRRLNWMIFSGMAGLIVIMLVISLNPVYAAPQTIWINGMNAEGVLGQPDFTSNARGTDNRTFNTPFDLIVDPNTGKVFVAEGNNNRILRFSSTNAFVNGGAAEAVLGQTDFVSGASNSGGVSASTLYMPKSICMDPDGRLWVSDTYNYRVLGFDNAASKPNGANAEHVLGKSNFTSTGYQPPSANTFNSPMGLECDSNGNLWLADMGFRRVLRFNNVGSKTNGADADFVLGQADFSSVYSNRGGAPAANTMDAPTGVLFTPAGELFVVESNNHRVLRFDDVMTKTNGADADGVLGQSNFSTITNATSQTGMRNPQAVQIDSEGRLYVSDTSNNRVLIFNNAANLANGAPADNVLGQSNFTNGSDNAGGLSAHSLYAPKFITFDLNANVLWVTDSNNHRILRWGDIVILPTATPTQTSTPTTTATPTQTSTPTVTATSTVTATPTQTLTPTNTSTVTPTGTVTDLNLSSQKINEGISIGSPVGSFTSTDLSSENSHTYALVSGTGGDDNASFNIVNGVLVSAEVFDFSIKNSYTVRVQSNNGNPGGIFEKAFTITILDTGTGNSAAPDMGFGDNRSNIVVDFLANDIPSSGETWDLSSREFVILPQNGTVSFGSIIYTPNSGYVGVDTVTYRVCDTGGYCVTGVVGFSIADGSEESTEDTTILPVTGFRPYQVTELKSQPATKEYQDLGSIWLEIPKLDVQERIVGVPIQAGEWDVSWLGRDIGYLDGSAYPTWEGNTVLTGHVFDAFGQPGVFNKLNRLIWGDEFIIHTSGQEYIYEVRRINWLLSPEKVKKVFTHEEYDWVTLLTCQGYNEKLDHYNWRMMVQAVLVDIQ